MPKVFFIIFRLKVEQIFRKIRKVAKAVTLDELEVLLMLMEQPCIRMQSNRESSRLERSTNPWS